MLFGEVTAYQTRGKLHTHAETEMEGVMGAFENAKKFFDACEAPSGRAGCMEYVAEGAPFVAQSEPLADIKTVEGYCEWMAAFAGTTAPGATYDLHVSCFDEANRTAVFATYHAKHTGEGGPVPPTNRETYSHYVYFLKMGPDDKVERMTKVWNAPWTMKELGWI
ncbi:MAG: hypothetical protein ACOC5M_02665 [Chloroflexota bacterium]